MNFLIFRDFFEFFWIYFGLMWILKIKKNHFYTVCWCGKWHDGALPRGKVCTCHMTTYVCACGCARVHVYARVYTCVCMYIWLVGEASLSRYKLSPWITQYLLWNYVSLLFCTGDVVRRGSFDSNTQSKPSIFTSVRGYAAHSDWAMIHFKII